MVNYYHKTTIKWGDLINKLHQLTLQNKYSRHKNTIIGIYGNLIYAKQMCGGIDLSDSIEIPLIEMINMGCRLLVLGQLNRISKDLLRILIEYKNIRSNFYENTN